LLPLRFKRWFLSQKCSTWKSSMQYCRTDFLVLAIFMPKNHKNVKLGKKCVPFREKIRFTIHSHGGSIVDSMTWHLITMISGARPPIRAAQRARRGAAQAGIAQAVTAHRPI
jgi:hypothetical protein